MSWFTYSDHLKQMMQTLIHDESFTGMTLVCSKHTNLFYVHAMILKLIRTIQLKNLTLNYQIMTKCLRMRQLMKAMKLSKKELSMQTIALM